MGTQELLNRIRVRPRRIGGEQRVEELQKPFRSARRESVHRMGHDVGMNVLGKLEADAATARARILRVVVGNVRNSREVREPYVSPAWNPS